MSYRVVRFFQRDKPPETLKTGLTLEQAQAHCSDPETSSASAASEMAREYTATHGPWFDGYEAE